MAVSKRKRQRMSRSAVWLITVTVLIAAFLSLKMITLIKTEHYYADKEREVAAAYEAESQRAKELEESAAYIKSNQYVEDEAKAKLHLGYPETEAAEPDEQAVTAEQTVTDGGQAEAGGQAVTAEQTVTDGGQAEVTATDGGQTAPEPAGQIEPDEQAVTAEQTVTGGGQAGENEQADE